MQQYADVLKRRRNKDKQWFEDDTFWRETYAFMFPEARIAEAADHVAKVLDLTAPSGKAVLDLCCGPGRCAVALAARGLSVTGVDRTKYLLDKARARAKKQGVRVQWIQDDMRTFVRKDSYDLAISMFTSFGYLRDRNEDSLVLKNIFTSLRPGGQVLIDVMGKETLAKVFQPTSAQTAPDGSILIEQPQVLEGWTRLRNTWTVVRDGKARRFTIELNLYSGRELQESLEAAAFTDVKLYGNLDGDPYGPDARRLVALGRKPS